MITRVVKALSVAFKAGALGVYVFTVILIAGNVATPFQGASLFAIGLFCLALASIADHPIPY